MFPFCLRAPCLLDGLHKAGNVSNKLWLMMLHPPLVLKTSLETGSRQRAALSNLPVLPTHVCGWGASTVPGMHSLENIPPSFILQSRETPNLYNPFKPF